MEGRIKCVISEKGIIIPIHNIALVDVRTHYIWSNADAENSNHGHKLSDDQYDALVRELEIIGKY
jgi:hypothetical protein